MERRASNFLNLGVQIGGYFLERVRLSARLVAPLQEVEDDRYAVDFLDTSRARAMPSPSLAVLYGASVGIVLGHTSSFVFAPGLLAMRSDVSDYGTMASLSLPFEWTTARHLRIGFELAVGQAVGGSQPVLCAPPPGASAAPCRSENDRRAGTAVLLQFYLGWSLGGV